jgi:hypothetical protein
MAEKFLLVTKRSIHIPGDERSRTNPGHGYPASTETVHDVKVFDSHESFADYVARAFPPSLADAVGYKVSETYAFKSINSLVIESISGK